MNQPPVAVATASPASVPDDQTSFTLDGTGSYDPDGTIVSYLWEQVSGPAGVLATPTGATSLFTPGADPYAAEVMADGPVAYWRLNETVGPVTSEVGSFPGALNAVVLGVPGVDGSTAAEFDNVSSVITVSDVAALNFGTGSFTAESWITKTTLNDWSVFVNKALHTGSVPGWYLGVNNSSNSLVFRTGDGVSGLTVAVALTTAQADALHDGNFHHLVGVRDGNEQRIYLDGVFLKSIVGASTLNVDNTVDLRIGRSGGATTVHHGRIDEVAIYPSALSAARILAHYNAGAA